MTRRMILALLVTSALAACTAAPSPQNSNINAPAAWSQAGMTDPAKKNDQQWWNHFGDATLNALMTEAFANSKTLAIAQSRVAEARASRSAARANLLPNVTGSGSATRENLGVNTNKQTYGIAEADLNASWELDLFGGNQARMSAASAILESTEANAHGVQVGLAAEVARNYFDMRNFERQIAISQQNLAKEQKTFDLVKAQQQGGMASDYDVQRAGAQVSVTAAQIPALKSALVAAQNRLNVLMGYPPGTKNVLLGTPGNLQPLSPQILVAAPADVLANRPDVRAAERQFAASIANASAATRDLFPKINLLGLYGVQTSNLFDAHPWSLGVNLVQPILDFGRVSSEIDAAKAQQKEAFLSYQQTVLTALEDMENALTNYLQETDRNASLQTARSQTARVAELAHLQFTNGEISLLDVLIAERAALDAEAALAASDAALRKDLVTVYAAAGGGWDVGGVTGATTGLSQTPAAVTGTTILTGTAPPPAQSTIASPGAPSNAPRVSSYGQSMVIE